MLVNLGRKSAEELAHILILLGLSPVLNLDALCRCSSQPTVIVHSEVCVYVYDRSNAVHEE